MFPDFDPISRWLLALPAIVAALVVVFVAITIVGDLVARLALALK